MEGGRDPFNRMPFAYSRADKSLLAFYRKLGAVRASLPCFKDGEFKILCAYDGLFIYKRNYTVCAINMGASKMLVSDTPFTDFLEEDEAVFCEDGRYRFSLGKSKFAIFNFNK
jgi:hypothetical protein